jgi:hypothetical protein
MVMARLLFTVTETFTVQGRGIVLLPELKPIGEERFSVGELLALKWPDGAKGVVRIGGLELAKPVRGGGCQLVVMLSRKSREEVPIGTEVWSVVNHDKREASSSSATAGAYALSALYVTARGVPPATGSLQRRPPAEEKTNHTAIGHPSDRPCVSR